MMDFQYHLPTRIMFGVGVLDELGPVVNEFHPKRVLVVTGRGAMRRTGVLDRVVELLGDRDVLVFEDVESDPSTDTVDRAAALGDGADLIVGLGGGSSLDAAKAVSVVLGNGGKASELIRGKSIAKHGPRIIAIPTTSGTGSEVTEVSVLSERAGRVKRSFRSVHMYPAVALDDPELTRTMPKDVTCSSGLDALTHAVEALTSKKSQPIPDVICLEAGRLVLENIGVAYEDGGNMESRNSMMLGSLMAGFGITHAGAGLAHGLSYSIWRVKGTAHGLACGILLPHVMRFNLGHDGGKYVRLARACGLKKPEDLIFRIEDVCRSMGVPERLGELGFSSDDIEPMIGLGMGGSTKLNPRPVDEKTMRGFIESII